MKNYRHKFNTIGYGHYVISFGIALLAVGFILEGVGLRKPAVICMIAGGAAIAGILLIVAYELHQDKVLNDEAIVADAKLDAAIRKKSFVLPYRGGEIWAEHLDGLYTYKEFVLEKFKRDIPQILKPSAPSAIAVALAETKIDAEILQTIVETFRNASCNQGKMIQKVAFVGLNRRTQKLLEQMIAKDKEHIRFEVFCCEDFEKAKEWLV